MSHFTCDRCGNYWRAYRADHCPACNHGAVWEYDRAQPAHELAAQIARSVKSGLFREVQS
jgi:hypothetical protein